MSDGPAVQTTAATLQATPEREMLALFVLNILLQIFDGVATYVGLASGFSEGNPLLATAMVSFGATATLVTAKVAACGLLTLLWTQRHSPLARPGFILTAAIYTVCSFAPWSAAIAHTHLG